MATTDLIVGAESGGNPFLKNPRSSAAGSGQFIDSTWLNMIRRYRPDLAEGRTDPEILALRTDPTIGKALGHEMTGRYADENTAFLRSRGIDPNPGNVYLAHFAGPSGAAAAHANPGATVEALLGPRAVAANPHIQGMTGGDLIAWAGRKMTPAQHMAKNLRQRYGGEGNQPAPTAPAGAEAGVERLKNALAGKSYEPSKISRAEGLIADAQKIGSGATNWLGVIGGTALSGLGGYLRDKEEGGKRGHDAAVREGLSTANDPTAAARLLMGSSDPKLQAAGIEMFSKLSAAEKANAASYNKTPTIVRNTRTGKLEAIQFNDKGQAVKTPLPGDVELTEKLLEVDRGTGTTLYGQSSQKPVADLDKDLQGAEKQKKVGAGEGERTIAQPATMASVRGSLSGLDALANEAAALKAAPGLPNMVGSIQGRSWVPTLSQDTANAEAKLDTLKSKIAFNVLQAMRDASKTGGALGSIAVEELKMLQNNLASLDTLQDEEAFKNSLDEIVKYSQGARGRLLRGYRDTYGADFDESEPPQASGKGYKVLKVE